MTNAAQDPLTIPPLFDASRDVGDVLHRGASTIDNARRRYTVRGAGANMWFKSDAFHFLFTSMSGDVTLAADVEFVGDGADPHRKACLLFRQSLDADSVYADVAIHGDGLTSLQYRDAKGADTREIRANVKAAPRRVRLVKRGPYVHFEIADASGKFTPVGGAARVELNEPYFIGLGVCSHNKDVVESATFSNVELVQLKTVPAETLVLHSTLETIAIDSTDRSVVYTANEHFEAPNWSPDGASLIFNGNGRLYRIPADGSAAPHLIDTGFATRCNNDHGISPGGKMLAISDQSRPPHQSIIYTLPTEGGTPKQITPNYPSYWHGWSPDGKTLTYCAQRDGKFGIFTIPIIGGEETRLTTAPKLLDDGPEYSHDGKHIYFNSDRTGLMQIWRMKPDGSALEQMTFDENHNWFAHPSPDGRHFIFLTYDKSVDGHPPEKDVMLRLMNLETREVRTLARLFGGQGTINVPSWSPDSKRVAFVSYQRLPG